MAIRVLNLKRTDVDVTQIVPTAKILDVTGDLSSVKSDDQTGIALKALPSVLFRERDAGSIERGFHALPVKVDDTLHELIVDFTENSNF